MGPAVGAKAKKRFGKLELTAEQKSRLVWWWTTMCRFGFESLVHLRLMFMHHADLGGDADGDGAVRRHFCSYLSPIDGTVREQRVDSEDIEMEGIAVLESGRCAEGTRARPVVVLDEVGKADVLTQPGVKQLIACIKSNPEYCVNGVWHASSSLLLSHLGNAAQAALGNVVVSYLSYAQASKVSALSGKLIHFTDDLFRDDSLEQVAQFCDTLADIASKDVYPALAGQALQDTLRILVNIRLQRQGASSAIDWRAADKALYEAVWPTAEALSYCTSGHMLTKVELCNQLLSAVAKVQQDASLQRPTFWPIVCGNSRRLLLAHAEEYGKTASSDARDEFLAS